MSIQIKDIGVTTDGSGNASVEIPSMTGIMLQVVYVPDGSSPLSGSASATITEDVTGRTVYANSAIGTSTYCHATKQVNYLASVASALTSHDYPICSGNGTIAIAAGGSGNSGRFVIYMG